MMPSKPSWSSNWVSTVKPSPVVYISAMAAQWSVGRATRSTAPGCIVQPPLLHVITAVWSPHPDPAIIVRLNLHALCCESEHSGLHRVHVVTPRNPFPPDHPVPWLQSCI